MLDAGATSDEEDRNGLTPVAIAAKQGYFDILEEFAANTSNPVNLRYLRIHKAVNKAIEKVLCHHHTIL